MKTLLNFIRLTQSAEELGNIIQTLRSSHTNRGTLCSLYYIVRFCGFF